MRYGVIGTGYWGENHVRVAAELAAEGVVDDVILCDIDESRVSNLAQRYDFDYVVSTAALTDREVDAAALATPSPTHRDIATSLLESGIDLLVEKPLAMTSEDAWHIVERAESTGRILAVGHIFRYHPALAELKQRIGRGEFGEIKYLNTNRFSYRVPRSTVGVLYSLAVHDIDVYCYLLDARPDWLHCRMDRWIRQDIDETATLMLGFGETTGVINESWQVPVFGKRRDLIVVGTERAAYLDYLEDTAYELFNYRVENRDGNLQTAEEGSKTHETDHAEPLRAEVEDFLRASANRGTPKVPGRIGAETVELLEFAERSDANRQVIEL